MTLVLTHDVFFCCVKFLGFSKWEFCVFLFLCSFCKWYFSKTSRLPGVSVGTPVHSWPPKIKKSRKNDLGFLYLFYKWGYTVTPINGLINGYYWYYLFIFTPISGGMGPYLKHLKTAFWVPLWMNHPRFVDQNQNYSDVKKTMQRTRVINWGEGEGRLHYQWTFFSRMLNIKLLFISLFDTYKIL